MSKGVRTRFAPSPTGFLHVGGVRTALFAWLIAREARGHFILRIEDTDRTRHIEESEQHIIDSLKWLGLDWDEGPYRQSERLDIYREWAQKLINTGRAYADPTDENQLNRLREQSRVDKKPFLYREHRPPKPPAWDGRQPLRFRSEPKAYRWRDEVMSNLSSGPEAIDDFIIIKTDGFPTYNFAHIVDDYEMKVTHITRTQEFLPSVPKFLNLYEALGIDRPKLATLPYVLATDGKKKLSKRDGAKDILDYRREGYLPEALINFMASLGWNDGTEQEIFSLNELIAKFNLSQVQRSGAKFDEQRLVWMNGHYIRAQSLESLAKSAEEFWPAEAKNFDEKYKKAVLALMQERLKFLAELPELSAFFFREPDEKDLAGLYKNPPDKQLKAVARSKYYEMVQAAHEELQQSDFSEQDLKTRLNNLMKKLDSQPGVLFPLVRIAVSGAESTPEIAPTLSVLGKQKSLKRLRRALALLKA